MQCLNCSTCFLHGALQVMVDREILKLCNAGKSSTLILQLT